MLLYGLYTLLGQVLNARGHFAAYMWAPAAANLVAIAGLVVFRVAFGTEIPVGEWTGPMIWLLAGTATLGVAAQAVVLVVPLRRSGFRYRPVWGIRGVGPGLGLQGGAVDVRRHRGEPARLHRDLQGHDPRR